tara:strand:- start:167 stop:361 length:195 start_codon:yes stop_codon:yes gene_type:complete
MPIILVCSSVYAESCMVVSRNWEFFETSEACLEISVRKANILFRNPAVYHVKPLCQEIILDKDT